MTSKRTEFVYAGQSMRNVPRNVTHLRHYPHTKRIDNGALSGQTKLIDVKLRNGLTSIGDCAFLSCRSLKRIQLPDTVRYIGK